MSNCIEYASLYRVDGIEGRPKLYLPSTVAVREGNSTETTLQASSQTPRGHKITYGAAATGHVG